MLIFKIVYTVYGSIKSKCDKNDFYSLSKIEKVIGEKKCLNNFDCYKAGLDSLSKSGHIGSESFLICLKEKLRECNFSDSSDYSIRCKCPLRSYIVKEMAN
jgi:hypothetical protein